MSRIRASIVIGTALLMISLALGLSLWLTTHGKKAPPTSRVYAQLWASAVVGKTTIRVLDRWPKPYQTYRDNEANQCYEWDDKGLLYNLCFKHGKLVAASLA
jgi:hypothetical protein